MTTKFRGILEWVKQQIEEEKLKAGDKLPSIRLLAEQFQCSKNTVVKALFELEKQHIVYAKPKSGYYVVDDYQTPSTHENGIDFLSAGPDQRIMPYEDFQHCINQAIDHYKEQLFTYSEHQGLFSLRVELVRYLRQLQVFTKPERLVITSGSQQALHVLSNMPFPNGKKNILIEQPTYFGMVDILKLNHIPTLEIELSMEGIDFERLENLFRANDIKFFYIIPRCHNPLGHHYTNDEKKKIVALAEKYDVYIVEDDYLAELDPNTKADPLFAYEPNGRVIYVKSFSKVFLPGLRIATVVLPEKMISSFVRYKFSTDFNTSPLSQGALEIYLKSGMFQYHLESVKELYIKKMKTLLEACSLYLPNYVQFTKPISGFYLTIFLPSHIDVEKLIYLLHEKHIYLDNASRMYLAENKQKAIRLSISQVNENKIHFGIQQLATFIIDMCEKKKYNPLSFKSYH
ncbi:PLP-dependent aminotransferase family protein [Psychrobacillus sp. NEAU-3TGS]|uniref:aminotransferase-like domain-containing protein n=1 Tax=Psychrobacillus sp. NEAU-3TGS TaxID=2995412 RepID=UPI002496464E|nr:PLP-dependent aminotransferase family protein [Psychrobacillus sp. NEAU-3TGS]MDI2588546.1 PLP-dependent aminotransferase family protein [Psychrobacillus sp. NEAU-3TGS]